MIRIKQASPLIWAAQSALIAVAGIALFAGGPAFAQSEVEMEEVASTDMWENIPWSVTGSAGFSSDDFGASVEMLIPMWVDPAGDTVVFLYPDIGAYDAGRQSYSIGGGVRRYVPGLDAILGFNIFYDHIETSRNNGFDSLGLGAELKTRLFDVNINWNDADDDQEVFNTLDTFTFGTPFATGNSIVSPRTMMRFNQFEAAMDGFDAEVGFLLDFLKEWNMGWLGDVRLFAGGYSYNNPFGSNIDGFRGRIEARVNDMFTFDVAYYGDKGVVNGHWFGGMRVSLPLGKSQAPIFHYGTGSPRSGQGRSMYAGSGAPVGGDVRDRLGENIARMSRLVTVDSGLLPDTANCVVDNIILVPDVVFVNNGSDAGNGVAAGSAGGTGIAENPEATIGAGETIAAANFDATGRVWNVFAQGGGPAYTEDVTATRGMRFLGQVEAPGGFTFGGPVKPMLTGGFVFDDLPVAQVSGFTIMGGFGGGDGIDIDNVAEVIISHNMIDVGGDGISFAIDDDFASGTPRTSNVMITNNLIQNSDDGVFTDMEDAEFATINMMITGNQFLNNSTAGLNIDVEDMDLDTDGSFMELYVHASDNVFAGNTDGIEIDADDNDSDNDNHRFVINLDITGNQFLNNTGSGIDGIIDSDSDVMDLGSVIAINIRSNNFQNNAKDGVQLGVDDFDADDEMPFVTIDVIGNTFINHGDDAVDLNANANTFRSFFANVSNNNINVTGDNAITFDFSDNDVSAGSPNFNVVIGNNFAQNVGGNGLEFQMSDDAVLYDLSLGGNTFDTVTGTGILIEGDGKLNLIPSTNNTVTNFGTEFNIMGINSGQTIINGVPRP